MKISIDLSKTSALLHFKTISDLVIHGDWLPDHINKINITNTFSIIHSHHSKPLLKSQLVETAIVNNPKLLKAIIDFDLVGYTIEKFPGTFDKFPKSLVREQDVELYVPHLVAAGKSIDLMTIPTVYRNRALMILISLKNTQLNTSSFWQALSESQITLDPTLFNCIVSKFQIPPNAWPDQYHTDYNYQQCINVLPGTAFVQWFRAPSTNTLIECVKKHWRAVVFMKDDWLTETVQKRLVCIAPRCISRFPVGKTTADVAILALRYGGIDASYWIPDELRYSEKVQTYIKTLHRGSKHVAQN